VFHKILQVLWDVPAICHPLSQPSIIRKLVTLLDQLEKFGTFALVHIADCTSFVFAALPLLVLRILGL
jgi:hypothetical protein